MRVAVVGASGNLGTALLRALGDESRISSLVGVARRVPADEGGVEWRAADIARDDLEPIFRGADAVVSLAWRIQPSHRVDELWQTNVLGSSRVFDAVGRARVPVLVYGSSVGAYSPGPKDERVDESWPVDGVPTSFYSRHKADVERRLDRFEHEHPDVRVVRFRPALVFQRASASEQHRFFLGPLVPPFLLRRGLLPIVPTVSGLLFQAVHADDVADAYRCAVVSGARGAFNLAAEPVLDQSVLPTLLGARALALPPRVIRAAVSTSWRLRLQPTSPGWLDMGLSAPLMDTSRARSTLGWEPRHDARGTLAELLEGMADRAGAATPPLDPMPTRR